MLTHVHWDGRTAAGYDLDQLVVLFGSPAMIGVICGCSFLIILFFSIATYLNWCCNHYDRRPRFLKDVSPERLKRACPPVQPSRLWTRGLTVGACRCAPSALKPCPASTTLPWPA